MTGSATPQDGAPITLSWLCHPATVLALVLLLVNDHVLKAAHPGLVTGKLSDVAGLVLAPPLVAVLLTLLVSRLPARAAALAGLVTVGAGFAVVKSSGYAAELASSAWTVLAGPSLVRADLTDLLTLPALGLAWWSWTRSRHRPVRRRTARLVRLLVVLPPAVLAVAATSVVRYPYAVGTALLDGQPAISIGSGYDDRSWPAKPADGRWSVSADGGTTWRPAGAAEEQRLSGPNVGQRQACVPTEPQRCYRAVRGHLRVEQSDDAGATWRVAWEVSDARREAFARRFDSPGDIRRHFASRDLIVYPVADGGHEVLVANGRDGLLRRGSDGGWRRAGFPSERDTPDVRSDDPPVLGPGGPGDRDTDVFLAFALSLTLGVTVTLLAAHLAIRRGKGPRWWSVAGSGVMLTAGIVLALAWERNDDYSTFNALLVVVLPACLLTAVSLVVRASYQGATGRWIGGALAGLLLTVVLAGLPLVGWLHGTPPQTRFAVALALLGTVPGVLLAIRIAGLVDPARAFENRYPPRPPYPNASYPPRPQAVPDPPYPNAPYPSRPQAAPDPPTPSQLRPPYPSQLPPG
ncbi:hypothetical protein IW249_002710 [Micromonospora vinacea]|uniref:Uncharacterized protein n=1 Tax=Micromonospora vinacea TaxID=709878 RepID=A0ABS0K107_9ACTN|nr:hypothetical protein [Micromonospora vinacea]MBG6102296.1 hypothetical protein [Micromonospora vinacea]